ncbi:hypothetical protein ALC53_05673, partial [Atta colombica]
RHRRRSHFETPSCPPWSNPRLRSSPQNCTLNHPRFSSPSSQEYPHLSRVPRVPSSFSEDPYRSYPCRLDSPTRISFAADYRHQAVVLATSIAAIRTCSPTHPLVDEILIVGPPLLDFIIQLTTSPVFISLLSMPHLFAVVSNEQRFLLMLAPAAFARVPLIPIHIRHCELAQVRTGTWFRRARCDKKQMQILLSEKNFNN